MKLRRLWQPGRLLFWQMVMFNVLSSVCSWAMRALPLNTLGLLLVGFVALLNVGFGLWQLARKSKAALTADAVFDDPIVTEVEPLDVFWPAEDYHQDYFNKNGHAPYCQIVVAPKVEKIKKKYRKEIHSKCSRAIKKPINIKIAAIP
jgi:hypothetical protein